MLDELVQLKENLKLTKEKFEITTKNIEVQDAEIQNLNEQISTKQTEVNQKLKLVEEARKVNVFENEKNRKYAKANAALRAKLQFIEDFKSIDFIVLQWLLLNQINCYPK